MVDNPYKWKKVIQLIVPGLFGRQIGVKTVLGSSLKDLTFTIILPSIFAHVLLLSYRAFFHPLQFAF